MRQIIIDGHYTADDWGLLMTEKKVDPFDFSGSGISSIKFAPDYFHAAAVFSHCPAGEL